MPETSLQFSDLTFGFDRREPLFEALSCRLSNDGDAGKIIALMGPSGVGKTTFCELALGTLRPRKGSATFAPSQARVAVIPQKGVIFDELSVEENIACLKFSRGLGKTFDAARVHDAVDALGLSHVLRDGTSAGSLSGGEAQRVMLARIQTVETQVLILDEPCSFLDNRVKDTFLRALRATVDRYRLLSLMVTHVWDEAQLVADEVIFFHQSPGHPVTLHRSDTTAARSRPPTLDALYGIHWPECAVIDVTELAARTRVSVDDIPRDASQVGLFRDGQLPRRSYSWADAIWRTAGRETGAPASRLPGQDGDAASGSDVVPVFYDAHGVLLGERAGASVGEEQGHSAAPHVGH